MKNIAVLGSTGSIGTQTLDVVRMHPDMFNVSVIAANSSDEMVESQIEEFAPDIAILADEAAAERLRSRYKGKTEILSGKQGMIEGAVYAPVETVVTSMVGFAGLAPTMAAIEAGKDIALANKETMVVAGELVTAAAKRKNTAILPVDSEHCALFQCLQGEKRSAVTKILLTCSGGPFRGKKRSEMENVSIKDVLAHPTWSMGKKITVDCASLVNKGLEVIEAKWLYDASYDEIQVVVHPQSIVHSMIEFKDGAVMAQLGSADMRLPIQYALTYPDRIESPCQSLDFWNMQPLTFEKPDTDTFRGLSIAYEAGRAGGVMPCIMNAANEIAVGAFLKGEIKFLDIYTVIERTMDARENKNNLTLELLFQEDAWARDYAKELVKGM